MSTANYDPLSTLKPGRYDYKIKVRVTRMWRGTTKTGEEFKSFNIMLIDNKRTRFHAFIPGLCADQHEKKFKEGNVCSITYFTVQPYKTTDIFRCLRNKNQLILSKDTKVEYIEDIGSGIAHESFDFYDHSELKALAQQTLYLTDVVGIIKKLDFITNIKNRHGQIQSQAKITITDGRSNVKVTFWDRFGEMFEKAMLEITQEPVIIIIASARVGIWNEEVDLSNVAATKIYLNYNHHSVIQLRKMLTQPLFAEQAFARLQKKKLQVMKVEDIKNLGKEYIDAEVLIHVKVNKVEETTQWYFNSCTTCHNQTDVVHKDYFCANCNRIVPHPYKEFKLPVSASDKTSDILIVLEDREIRTLIGKRAIQLIQEECGDKTFPESLKSIAGKDYTIKIIIKEMNIVDNIEVYTARDICNGFKLPRQEQNVNTQYTQTTTSEATSSTLHYQDMST